jgi:hypothetical protein
LGRRSVAGNCLQPGQQKPPVDATVRAGRVAFITWWRDFWEERHG